LGVEWQVSLKWLPNKLLYFVHFSKNHPDILWNMAILLGATVFCEMSTGTSTPWLLSESDPHIHSVFKFTPAEQTAVEHMYIRDGPFNFWQEGTICTGRPYYIFCNKSWCWKYLVGKYFYTHRCGHIILFSASLHLHNKFNSLPLLNATLNVKTVYAFICTCCTQLSIYRLLYT